MMSEIEIKNMVKEFKAKTIGDNTKRMCFALCYPLSEHLKNNGIENEVIGGEVILTFENSKDDEIKSDSDGGHVFKESHFWLKLLDNTIIDPTADQFDGSPLPPIYIGDLPQWYNDSKWYLDRTENRTKAINSWIFPLTLYPRPDVDTRKYIGVAIKASIILIGDKNTINNESEFLNFVFDVCYSFTPSDVENLFDQNLENLDVFILWLQKRQRNVR